MKKVFGSWWFMMLVGLVVVGGIWYAISRLCPVISIKINREDLPVGIDLVSLIASIGLDGDAKLSDVSASPDEFVIKVKSKADYKKLAAKLKERNVHFTKQCTSETEKV